MILIGRASFSFIALMRLLARFGEFSAEKTAHGARSVAGAWRTARELERERAEQKRKEEEPQIHAEVDDEATILVEYAAAHGIIQASWNWPFSRKDFEIYTERAYALSIGPEDVRIRPPGGVEAVRRPGRLPDDESEPVSYLIAVARGRMRPSGRSSLENNLIVTEILAAARESARTGRRVVLP